jgi:hypothetical protein
MLVFGIAMLLAYHITRYFLGGFALRVEKAKGPLRGLHDGVPSMPIRTEEIISTSSHDMLSS